MLLVREIREINDIAEVKPSGRMTRRELLEQLNEYNESIGISQVDDIVEQEKQIHRMTPEEASEYVRKYNKSFGEAASKIEEKGKSLSKPIESLVTSENIDSSPKVEINKTQLGSEVETTQPAITHLDEFQKKSIDPDEIYRLYYEKGLSMVKIAQRYGYRTSSIVSRIFKENGWESRPSERSKVIIKPEEVHRLYFEEKRTLLEIGKEFGFKSAIPIRRIFEENGWETRRRWKRLDSHIVYNLYFNEDLSFEKLAKKLGLDSIYPIERIFEVNGWSARRGIKKFDVDPDEVYRLYYEEGRTMKQIATHYGYKTSGAISRIFRKNNWDPWRTRCVDYDIDVDEVYGLYYMDKLSLAEIQRRLGKTAYAINKVFEKMEWEKRKIAYETEELRLLGQKEASDRYIQSIKEMREKIFGQDCTVCGNEMNAIHRKDGKKHSSNLLWSRKGLESVEPDEWVPLCMECHLVVHTLMRINIQDWQTILSILKNVDTHLKDRISSK